MESIVKLFSLGWTVLGRIAHFLWHFPWHNLIDIGIMTFLVYQTYIHFRGTRAMRILSGFVVLGFGYLVAQALGLFLTSWLFGAVWAAAVIFVIVIFQGEIRQMLEQVNPGLSLTSLLRRAAHVSLFEDKLVTIAETAFALASKRYGALLVFERQDFIEPFLRSSGAVIDAYISAELLETVFNHISPLHDGAVYIRKGRAYRASCVLPLSGNQQLASFYGTRHRAALGISEQSDALSVVVSEERGTVSVAEKGKIMIIDTPTELLNWLAERLRTREKKARQERSFKVFMTYNWRPKLLSLAVVSLLWFVLVGQQNTEVGFSVPVLYYNVPKSLTIDSDRIEEVYVNMRGSREILNFLDHSRLRVSINLKDASVGWQHYTISDKDINAPLGLQLTGVTPPEIRLFLREKPPGNSEK